MLVEEKISPNPFKEILTNFRNGLTSEILSAEPKNGVTNSMKTANSENRTRNVQMKFRVTRDEYDFIMKKVEVSGKKTINNYLRTVAIAGKIFNVNLEDLKIMSANIGRISSSVNQIAKRVNATGNVYEEDIREIKRMEAEIWQELKSIRLKLRSISQ